MNAIEITGLFKSFSGKRMTRVEALKGLNLSVSCGEVFGILGPNGAGKSTTIKAVMGLLKPTAGSVKILGCDASQSESRRNVGYLPENPAFFEYLTAYEYISFVGRQFGMDPSELRQRVGDVLKRLDLWDVRNRPMRSYSKGMVQRVGVAQTLVHDPDVYILDEPMSGLDPIGRALVKDIITELKDRGKCVFFSTHITDDVEKICNRVGIILKGSLVALERVEDILRNGVEGYMVQLKSVDDAGSALTMFSKNHISNEVTEYYVPSEGFNRFMAEVIHLNRKVVLIETKRKNLQDYFLNLVAQGQGS